MEKSLSIDECARRLEEYTKSKVSYDEIKEMLVIMRNHDSNWIKPSVFVYQIYKCSNYFVTPQALLTQATGYCKSHIYNFKLAGEMICKQQLNVQDLQEITLMEFLKRKDFDKNGLLCNIQQIGSYKSYLSTMVYLYRALYNDNKVYFKVYRTKIAKNEIIEVKKDTAKEGGVTYLYQGVEIELFNFVPDERRSVNLNRKSW